MKSLGDNWLTRDLRQTIKRMDLTTRPFFTAPYNEIVTMLRGLDIFRHMLIIDPAWSLRFQRV